MINYGGYTATKSISVPQTIPITLISTGNGSGVTQMSFSTRTAMTVSIVGGYFYDTIDGNSGQNTTRTLITENAGNGWSWVNPLYIKVASGTARLKFSSKKLRAIDTISIVGVNSPIPNGTLDNVIDLVRISDGVGILSNINTNCTKLINLVNLDQKGGIVSGTLDNCDNLERVTIVGDNHTISCDVSLLKVGCSLEVVGANLDFFGDATLLDPNGSYGFFYGSALANCTANISAWGSGVKYIQTACPYVVTTVIGMTGLGHLNITHSVLSSTVVNQILADLRVNVATVKGYGDANRTYNLTGANGTGAPTGQGLIDKQWLIDWVGGAGQRNTVTTR